MRPLPAESPPLTDSRDLPATAVVDLAAVVAAPAFVMGMVASLVFFLIEVIYRGAYSGRLVWTFGFFVFGAVLIARISIQQSRAVASMYGLGLGAACFVAMLQFVDYPPGPMATLGPAVNLALMALVWFCADRLTWDCTHFDSARKASGRGLLAASGLESTRRSGSKFDAAASEDDESEPVPGSTWLERYHEYRRRRKEKPHTPGTWVLYFALAALPLFALGQSLIPSDDSARRATTFWCMAGYIGSALMLLVTTSLMGLRRYLEERGARIPPALTYGWLGLGAGLVVLFLAVGAVLPRPHSETPLVDLGTTSKGDRRASDYAVVRDSNAGKGDGAKGSKTESGKSGPADANSKKAGGAAGKNNSGGSGDQKSGKGGDSKGDSKGSDKGGDQGKGDGDKSQQQGKQSKSQDQSKGDGKKAEGEQNKQDGEQDKQDGDKRGGDKPPERDDGGSKQSSSSPPRISKILEPVAGFLRYLVWIVVALAVIAAVVYFCLKGLAPFTHWAQSLLDWFRSLFGRKARESRSNDVEVAAPEERGRANPPFDEFTNPFRPGTPRRDYPGLVRYTFSALEAWAEDRGAPRLAEETPREFAVRLGHAVEELDEPGYAVAELYTRTAYGRSAPASRPAAPLEALWSALEAAPRDPLPPAGRVGEGTGTRVAAH